MVDFQFRWVRGAVTFPFTDPYDIGTWEDAELRYNLPASAVQDMDGEYQEDGTVEPRVVSLTGRLVADGQLIAATPDALRAAWDTLSTALTGRTEGRLYKNSDRFLNCRLFALSGDREEGLLTKAWTATFRAADPYYYEDATQNQALAVGTTSVTAGGGSPAIPVFTVAVSSASVGVVSVTGNGAFQLANVPAGTYRIDCAAGTVQKDTGGGTWADALAFFQGDFWSAGIGPGATPIVVSASGGASVSSVSVSWRRRYLSG